MSFRFFCSVFCFVLMVFRGPGGGLGGFHVGSKSSGKPLLPLPRRKPPKAPPGPPKPPEPLRMNRLVQNTVEIILYCVL